MKLISGLRDGSAKRRHIIIIVAVGVIGTIALLTSFAATVSTGFEPEDGSVSPSANIRQNATASGSKYVQFGRESGQYVIYTANSGTTTAQIWRMKADGTEAAQLTNDPDHEIHWARPSPDGTKILFYKQDKGKGVNDPASNVLWIMNSDGTNQREVLKKDRYGWSLMGHGEWSPDSQKIIQLVGVSGGAELVIMNENGGNLTQVTQSITIDGFSTSTIDPSWPSANTIVYVRQWDCAPIVSLIFGCNNQDIFKLDLQSNTETRLTNDKDLNFDPYLSPDGTTYVWLRINCSFCQADLYKANASTVPLNPQPIIADGGVNTNGTFSPDGQYFVFAKREITFRTKIYRIKLDGTGLARISKSTDDSSEEVPSYY